MNCLIVEDETFAADHLIYLLQAYHPQMKIAGRTDSIGSTVNWLKQHPVDLIFMDIHLNDGISFHVFEQLLITTPIIFCTAYDKFAIQAFSVNSISYLLKPIDKDELDKAIQKFRLFHQDNPKPRGLPSAVVPYQKRFLIKQSNQLLAIEPSQIAYLYTRNKTIIIVTNDNKQHSHDATLDQMEKDLDPTLFFRINRQYIIRLDAIATMVNETRGRVKIETIPACKEEMIVSVDRSSEFKKWLKGEV